MDEIESDILIAEPEEETEEQDSVIKGTNFGNESFNEQSHSSLFEFKEVPREKNKTIKKETDAFVNYNYNNLNKVYKKYDVVKTYVPKKQNKPNQNKEFEKYVTEQSEYVPEKESFVIERKKESNSKFQLKPKAKSWLVSIIVIFALLGGLSIYNAVHISNLSSQAEQTSINIGSVSKKIDKVIDELADLEDEGNIVERADEMQLGEISEENKVTIELNPKNEIEEYKSQTNFFDRICNFFRRLFGGK